MSGHLTHIIYMKPLKKIVVLGPESTGKSTLSQQLASHYQTLWVPEFARAYLHKKGNHYTYSDLLEIAKGQLASEDEQAVKAHLSGSESNQLSYIPLFIDTNMHVMQVWYEYVFNDCPNAILNRIAERNYDLYLLCYPDLVWTPDPLREYPDEQTRKRLFHYYKEMMLSQPAPWHIISGNYEERFRKAIAAVESLS